MMLLAHEFGAEGILQRFLNRDVDIVVTRVLQTVAGRMIFAHPKAHGNGR